jgi:hypothetical protein
LTRGDFAMLAYIFTDPVAYLRELMGFAWEPDHLPSSPPPRT